METVERHAPLAGEASSAARARLFTREMLSRWGLDAVEPVASLLVSELVANVVLHAHTACRLEMGFDGERLRVGVRDGSPRPPVRRRPANLDPAGRGLALVDALAAAWGWDPTERGGKVVWFELTCPQERDRGRT